MRSLWKLLAVLLPVGSAWGQALPDRALVGYWHNFSNEAGVMALDDVPEAYDVVSVAFAVPREGSTFDMAFVPDVASPDVFREQVRALQARGQRVLISIGGAEGVVRLRTTEEARRFTESMVAIIEAYGFDGMDIDLEGASLALEAGDTDFRAPTTPGIVHFIAAVRAIVDHFGDDFILTAAPETVYVQGGLSAYGGPWGAYLPVLHALRDALTLLHVQHYNTGSMLALDGAVYSSGTADFHVAMADMLLQGFPVGGPGGNFFPAFRADQVAIGLPAAPAAAGSGYTPPAVVQQALDYLVRGVSYGGAYELGEAYPRFRGLMTWSVNWDAHADFGFSSPHRAYLDALAVSTIDTDAPSSIPPAFELRAVYPDPVRSLSSVEYTLAHGGTVELGVYDLAGRVVKVLVHAWQPAGRYAVTLEADGLPSGSYLCRLRVGGRSVTEMLTVMR